MSNSRVIRFFLTPFWQLLRGAAPVSRARALESVTRALPNRVRLAARRHLRGASALYSGELLPCLQSNHRA